MREEWILDYVLEMRNITKVFPGIIANDDISLQVKKGEIHALLGENGAGKSTLMSVLFGLYEPEKGQILIRGKEETIHNPNDATRLGIGMVHQHFKLVDVFTTLENIVLGTESTKHGVLQMDDARKKVMELSERYGLMIDPDAKVADISVGMQQRVEILKMLYRDSDILIFDEPTAVLTPQEIEELIQIIKGLAAEGKSILFISHKLAEIKQVADRCTVLRRGKSIGTVNAADVSMEDLSEMMVGRPVMLQVEKGEEHPGDIALEVRDLSVRLPYHKKDKVHNVSFKARKGEITCIAGIDNNGQTELVLALAGIMPSTGTIILDGQEVQNRTIRYRNTHGLAHIPEDRHRYGLVLDFPLRDNLILQNYFEKQFNTCGFLRQKSISDNANRLIKQYDIRCGQGEYNSTRAMSGGNQQKAIIAREMDRAHDVLIAVQPTRGLDVGAIEYIHKQLIKERDSGKAVVLVSLELDEVMDVSDRILVMCGGELVCDVRPKDVTFNELGLYMSGAKRDEINE
ncbi:MAG: ABC transporter ATP-binding protein [Oscillospiraceae bacterium]|nr:ABC transporter ATP-binding protein [Oscillospiraceae bacterium]